MKNFRKVSLGLTKPASVDLKVYDLYLRARTLLHQRGAGVDLSIKLFEQIIEQDSTYQPAWTGLAQAWIVRPIYTKVDSLRGNHKIGLTNAERAVQMALSLDSQDAEALAALATVLRKQKKYGEAYDYYKKAISINDQSAVILEDYVQFLLQVGYRRESLPYAKRMTELDPLTAVYLLSYSSSLDANGLTKEALNALKKSMRLDPDFPIARTMIFADLNLNMIDSAFFVLEHYHLPERTRSSFDQQLKAVEQHDVAFDFGAIKSILYFALNELDQQDALLTKVLDSSKSPYAGVGYNPIYAPQGLTFHAERFISDPRMKEAIRNEGLVEFWKEHGWPDRCKPVGDDDFICE